MDTLVEVDMGSILIQNINKFKLMDQRPNKQEINFLNYSYNFFLDIYEEVKDEKSETKRMMLIK
jgi:hypothetical protein